ncbi:MAG TPA: hypothetical protein VFN61_06050 [Acidimicrobiales bacterium]|nr:hypothetical protein [Acidimicrobiales bacterium]
MTARIVVASVVDKDPLCVSEFLACLDLLELPDAELGWMFSVPQDAPRLLANMLARFTADHPGCVTIPGASRDELLQGAVAGGASHVFVVEPTLLLPPPLVAHLLQLDLDIVTEVFWTRWQPAAPYLPNVWACDEYSFCGPAGVGSAPEAQTTQAGAFLSLLHDAGTFRVGGVTGCTLISRRALLAGISFARLPNLSLWDAERHFSIRAAALGFDLWADTHYPPLHLYRPTDLAMADHFWARWARTGPVDEAQASLAELAPSIN